MAASPQEEILSDPKAKPDKPQDSEAADKPVLWRRSDAQTFGENQPARRSCSVTISPAGISGNQTATFERKEKAGREGLLDSLPDSIACHEEIVSAP